MRKAASMIELVIAIVVMGIAMMTLPLMLTRVQSNNDFAMQQEAILMARTQLGDILTYRWDENSSDSSGNIAVLDTNSSYFKRYPDDNSTRRIGHVKGEKRRKFFSSLRYASVTLGKDGNETTPNDIDDFNDKNSNLTNSGDTNATLGYKLYDSNMTTTVQYINDTPPATGSAFDFNTTLPLPLGENTSSIKMITVVLQNSQLDGNLTLRTFSCNIGANMLLRRDF